MRTLEEIEVALAEAEIALRDAQEWLSREEARYQEECGFWGAKNVPSDTLQWASTTVTILTEKVNTLNWILNK